MLVCARLRHVAGTQWGNKKYMNMKHLEAVLDDAFVAGEYVGRILHPAAAVFYSCGGEI